MAGGSKFDFPGAKIEPKPLTLRSRALNQSFNRQTGANFIILRVWAIRVSVQNQPILVGQLAH